MLQAIIFRRPTWGRTAAEAFMRSKRLSTAVMVYKDSCFKFVLKEVKVPMVFRVKNIGGGVTEVHAHRK